jgi:hypothetical protein
MRFKAALTVLLLLILAASVGTSTVNAHAPWKHQAEPLVAPKLHYLKFLGREIRQERNSLCRIQPQPRSVYTIATWNRDRFINKWITALKRLEDKSSRCVPKTWRGAVEYVQAVYPGTGGWLMSCSDAEGGWSNFVQNAQGANVWGWLQFNPGTYHAYAPSAKQNARSRGLYVPDFAMDLNDPLGQAVTGGYMRYTDQDASHWRASWGNGC